MAEKPAMLSNTATPKLDMPRLDQHVHDMSLDSLWEKSYLCPCRNPQTRQPASDCRRCNGRGVAFLPPRKIELIVQSQEKGIMNTDLGLLDSGTAIGTPQRETKIAFRDRITIPHAKVSQSMIFNINERRIKNGFFMVYDVNQIEYAATMDKELVEGEDYTFDIDTNRFHPKQHLLGKNVSLNILTTLRYMVADLLKEHRYRRNPNKTGMEEFEFVNQKLLLKREDIFVDREAFELGTDDDTVEMIETKREPSPDGLNGFFGR